MDDRIVALKLVLQHLDVGQEINTVDQRMEMQKAVYLTQSMGIELGYSYGWYLKGPYSPQLTREYYFMHGQTDVDPAEGRSLKAKIREKLDGLRALIDSPAGGVSRPHWLELLASIHYLLKKSGFSSEQARERIKDAKPHLSPHFNSGLQALMDRALV